MLVDGGAAASCGVVNMRDKFVTIDGIERESETQRERERERVCYDVSVCVCARSFARVCVWVEERTTARASEQARASESE